MSVLYRASDANFMKTSQKDASEFFNKHQTSNVYIYFSFYDIESSILVC